MRPTIALFALLAACSTTYECDDCCRDGREITYEVIEIDRDAPGARDPGRRTIGFDDVGASDKDGKQTRSREVVVYVDSDDDGLPDVRRRLDRDDFRPTRGREARIERALEQLERAIADVRRAMAEAPPTRARAR